MEVIRLDHLDAIDFERHQRARKDYVFNMVTTKVSGIHNKDRSSTVVTILRQPVSLTKNNTLVLALDSDI
jgi:hypothetical protein